MAWLLGCCLAESGAVAWLWLQSQQAAPHEAEHLRSVQGEGEGSWR